MKIHTTILNAALVATLAFAGTSFVNAGDEAKKDQYSKDKVHAQKSTLANVDPSEIEGKNVLDKSGQQLGDIDEVVHGNNGEQLVVIGLEDSLREVAVPIEKLEWSADRENFVTMLDRTELEAMPDYDPMDLPEVDDE